MLSVRTHQHAPQRRRRRARNVRHYARRTARRAVHRTDAHHIAHRVAFVRVTAPRQTRHVHVRRTIHRHVSRMRHCHKTFLLHRVARALGRERMAEHLVEQPVGRVQRITESLGETGIMYPQPSRSRPAAVIGQRRHVLAREVLVEHRIAHVRARREIVQTDLPPVAVVRVVAREHMQERINRQIVDVARPLRIQLQPRAVGADAHHATALPRDHGAIFAHRATVAVITHRDVQPAINAHRDAIRCVIGAAEIQIETQPGHQILRHVGNPVACRIAIRRQIRRVHHIERAPVVRDAARTVHLGKHRILVGPAVMIGVRQPHHAPASLGGGERQVRVDAYEHGALHRPRQTHGIHRHRRRGKDRRGKPVRDLHLLQHRTLARGVVGHHATLRRGRCRRRSG